MNLVFKNKVQKIIAVVLVVAIALGIFHIDGTVTYAFDEKKGMITSPDRSVVDTKDAPSASAGRVSGLVYGKPVTVINETVDAAGEKWYQIKYLIKDGAEEKKAYCPAKNILLNENAGALTYHLFFSSGYIPNMPCSLRDLPSITSVPISAS